MLHRGAKPNRERKDKRLPALRVPGIDRGKKNPTPFGAPDPSFQLLKTARFAGEVTWPESYLA
jgi:hypothetical protein